MTNEYHAVSPQAVSTPRLGPSAAATDETDTEDKGWAYCEAMLPKVSRSFVVPISMLTGELRKAVTCGYLLCRIVDTIEDEPNLSLSTRRALYDRWLRVLDGDTECLGLAEVATSNSPDMDLAAEASTVLAALAATGENTQTIVKRWVIEMTLGMRTYSERQHARSSEQMLLNLTDLDRYCYYVAGTVGHMLTELFGEELGQRHSEWNRTSTRALRQSAEAFGQGLQLVNIIKDVAKDAREGRSFLPRSLFGEDTLEANSPPSGADLTHPTLEPLFVRARAGLRGAVDYTCRIPEVDDDIRLFCLIPLSMAVKTLKLCEENPDLFNPEKPVKISREEVHQTLEECEENVGSNDGVRSMFACLYT
jgi:farnesyl-diphosphate farnesyltransferase